MRIAFKNDCKPLLAAERRQNLRNVTAISAKMIWRYIIFGFRSASAGLPQTSWQQLIELTAIQYSEHFQRSAVMTPTAPRAAYLAASANDPPEESRSFAADTATAWCS